MGNIGTSKDNAHVQAFTRWKEPNALDTVQKNKQVKPHSWIHLLDYQIYSYIPFEIETHHSIEASICNASSLNRQVRFSHDYDTY